MATAENSVDNGHLRASRPLALKNRHPRDERIEFYEEQHLYVLDGKELNLSVSGLWGRYFPHFDPDECIGKYYEGWATNTKSPYYNLIRYLEVVKGMDEALIKSEIKQMWSMSGDQASTAGTYMHLQIELCLNDQPYDADSHEMRLFLAWRGTWCKERNLVPYRTEWSIYDEKGMVAGQIDALFKAKDADEYVMCDWKRCTPAKNGVLSPHQRGFKGECGLGPCSHLASTNYYHYAIQQNSYRSDLSHASPRLTPPTPCPVQARLTPKTERARRDVCKGTYCKSIMASMSSQCGSCSCTRNSRKPTALKCP